MSQLLPNHPPPTQGRIFVNPAQQPLRIFVEPSEVPNRTKLIRTLKTSGASTCEDVAEADIIVVTPETASSKELIEGWSEKTFLDANWVYESIRRGRAYLEDEMWGGFNLETATGAGGSNVTFHKSPLPTPRETPSESHPQQDAVMQQQPVPLPEPLQSLHAGSPVPVSQFPQQQQMPQPQQFPGGQVVSVQGMTQVMVPANVLAQLMGMAQQQGMPSGIGMAQMAQIPMNMLPAGQPIPPGYMPQAIPFMAQPGMFPQGGFPVAQQQPQLFPPQLVNLPFPQPMDIGSPVAGSTHHKSSSPEMQGNSSMTASYRGSPMDQDERPATPESEERHHAPSTSRQKLQDDERGSTKRRREDHRKDSDGLGLFMKRPGEPYLFFVQVEIRNRARIADPIKRHGGKLVPDIIQADFVILGHPATTNFEEWLRQSDFYGKLPLKPQWVFDCLEENELVDVSEYVYEGLRVEKKRGRRSKTGQRYIITAVKSGSDEDEEEDDEAVDDDEEHEKHGQVKKKRKVTEKPVKQGKVKAEKQKMKVEKEKEREAVKEERGPKKKVNSKTIRDEDTTKSNSKGKTPLKEKGKAPANATSKTQQSELRSPPSPPPPTIVVTHSTGKHFYTKEDYDYCDEYIPILLARDYTMSNSALAEKLHAKMPHHSAASWMTQLSTPALREKLAQQRRRAEIQSRKVAAQTSGQPSTSRASHYNSPSTSSSQQDPMVSASTVGHPGASESTPAPATLIATMAEFFATGRADNLEDAAVWRVMAQEHPELNAHGWEEFWSQNSDMIATEVARRTGLQSHDVNGEGPKAEPE